MANRHEELEEELYISEDGYMEAFLVNETEEDVWFDDFSIQSTSSFIVQETHYDPWGLELTGLGFQAGGGVKVNRYLYNGNEIMRDLNLELYDFKARFYDPVIGRFLSVDPLSADEKQVWFSPYQFGWNNPIRFNDPDGKCPECKTERQKPFDGEIYRSTGGADYVFGKGAWTRQGGTLNEVTVTATQSDHERTMSNPVVRHMHASNARLVSEIAPFARHMVRSSIDAAGYTGAGISAAGMVVAPFAPPIGAGLIGVGGAISTTAGGASTLMYMSEGNYKSAAIEGSLTITGAASGKYLQNLASPAKGLINSTEHTILQGLNNTSLDIINFVIAPKIK